MTIAVRYWRWVTFALSVWFSLMATRFFFLPLTEAASEQFARHLAGHGLTFYLHAGGGAVALTTGALQWVLTARSRRSRWHRLIGRTYVVAIAVGGLAGLAIATRAFGGIAARAGFSTLAVVWLASTMLAWTRARAQDWTRHRAWMVRSFALTFAAVTLRVWLPLLVTAGLSFEVAYRVVAWWSWIPNLVVAEWLIAGERRTGSFRVRDVLSRAGGPAMSPQRLSFETTDAPAPEAPAAAAKGRNCSRAAWTT